MSERTRRNLGRLTAAMVLGTTLWSVVVACSTDESRVTFVADDAADASTAPPGFDGSFAELDSGVCQPAAPTSRVTPPPPKPFAPGSCTATQLDGYLKDCLASDGNVCQAFKSANPTCAACVESSSSDPAWGPIVFYGARRYYDYNYGGCIANTSADASTSACGAAESRYLECRHAACAGCLPAGFPLDFAPFYGCQAEKATDKLCAAELAEIGTTCAGYFAAKPMDVCQSGGLPVEQYLRRLVTGWCGGTIADASDDGG